MVMMDAVVRLLPGALGSETSAVYESFSEGLLDYPQYTRPPDFRGMKVPEVLLSGNHAEIARWRKEAALEKTRRKRPDLLNR
jgi:tRNA (guanine37-N1)-methyltransferase